MIISLAKGITLDCMETQLIKKIRCLEINDTLPGRFPQTPRTRQEETHASPLVHNLKMMPKLQ